MTKRATKYVAFITHGEVSSFASNPAPFFVCHVVLREDPEMVIRTFSDRQVEGLKSQARREFCDCFGDHIEFKNYTN